MVIARHVSMTASRVRSCNRSTSLSLSVPKNNRLIPFAMVNANANATFANATTLIFDVERYNIALKYCSRVSNAWTTIRDATTMDVVTYEKDRVNTPPPPPRVMMASKFGKGVGRLA
tara:strand:- start:93 stop:443 length:351 start_codon:yes stop_codon:yes gene_type:complete